MQANQNQFQYPQSHMEAGAGYGAPQKTLVGYQTNPTQFSSPGAYGPHHLFMVLHHLFMVNVVTHMRQHPTLRWAAIHPPLPITQCNITTNPTSNIRITPILPVLRISFHIAMTKRWQVVLLLWGVKRFLWLRLSRKKWLSLFRVKTQQMICCIDQISSQNQRTNENHIVTDLSYFDECNTPTFQAFLHDNLHDNWNEIGCNFHVKGQFILWMQPQNLVPLTGFHPSWSTFLRYCNVSKKLGF